MSSSSGTFSVIGPDVVIRGNVEASADLHVDGQVIGDISCASLVQGEGSSIEGEIKAGSARFSGTVKGRIEAKELIVLKSAQIDGDVSYETLTIEQGASVNGRFAPRGANLVAPANLDAKPVGQPKSKDEAAQLALAN